MRGLGGRIHTQLARVLIGRGQFRLTRRFLPRLVVWYRQVIRWFVGIHLHTRPSAFFVLRADGR